MKNIPVFSVVAFSGTGKTTLIEKLVRELKQRGLRVAVVKHDAHEFEIDREGKDSWRFTKAGADVTAIVSATKAAIMENRAVTIEALLEKITDVDIIITEGYKAGPWPKIAVMRAATGKPLPIPMEDCIAVITDVPREDIESSATYEAAGESQISMSGALVNTVRTTTNKPLLALADTTGLADLLQEKLTESCY